MNEYKDKMNWDIWEDVMSEGRLGFSDIEKLGSEIASKIDLEARRRGSADMSPGDADKLRYEVAKEMRKRNPMRTQIYP